MVVSWQLHCTLCTCGSEPAVISLCRIETTEAGKLRTEDTARMSHPAGASTGKHAAAWEWQQRRRVTLGRYLARGQASSSGGHGGLDRCAASPLRCVSRPTPCRLGQGPFHTLFGLLSCRIRWIVPLCGYQPTPRRPWLLVSRGWPDCCMRVRRRNARHFAIALLGRERAQQKWLAL